MLGHRRLRHSLILLGSAASLGFGALAACSYWLPASKPVAAAAMIAVTATASWFGGLSPGLLATLTGLVAAVLLNREPANTLPSLIITGALAGLISTALVAGARRIARKLNPRWKPGADAHTYREAFAHLPLLTLVYDQESGKILDANHLAHTQLGFDRDEIVGQDIGFLFPNHWRDLAPHLETAAQPSRSKPVLLNARRKDNRFREMEIVSSPISFGSAAARLLVAIDVTERAKMEKELRRAKRAAEAANKAKAQFLAILSHELRTPLTPVVLTIDSLLAEPLSKHQRAALHTIRRNIQLEVRLIEDMLEFIRADRGSLRVNMSVLDIHEIIHRVVEICRSDLDRANQFLNLELKAENPYVYADPSRIYQVLWNLIKNASKFTPRAGRIAISTRNEPPREDDQSPASSSSSSIDLSPESIVSLVPAGPIDLSDGLPHPDEAQEGSLRDPKTPRSSLGRLVIDVADNGLGIDPDELERIFDPFAQGRRSKMHWAEGLGLGLAISRSIAIAHGGSLRATSAGHNRGSTFSLELQLARKPDPVPVTAPPASNGSLTTAPNTLKILLVDDDAELQACLANLLRNRSFQVTSAKSFEEARHALKNQRFDLLLSDIQLPDGSGLDLVKFARLDGPNSPHIPAIALSGSGSPTDILRTKNSGFAVHLTKPITLEQLNVAIQNALSLPPR